MSIYLRNILRFALLILLQVLIVNQLPLLGWGPPFVAFLYPLFIILLPIRTPTSYALVFAFFLGLIMDAFMNTGGIHAFVCVLIAFFRKGALRFFLPEKIEEYGLMTPSPQLMTWQLFLVYTGILSFLHALVYSLIEVWSSTSFLYALEKISLTFVGSMVMIIIYMLLFGRLNASDLPHH